MLAYVFWHRPRASVSSSDYESRLRAFHLELGVCSASFRVETVPFVSGGAYEDWYLVESWTELGALNLRAISDRRAKPHDAVAGVTGEGWGAVYGLVRGERRAPRTTLWVSKPADQSYKRFLSEVREPGVWQRQLALGPAPEFCLAGAEEPATGDPERALVYQSAIS